MTTNRAYARTVSGRPLLLAFAGIAACGGGGGVSDPTTGTTEQALTGADAGTITISGNVSDALFPQAGITITLSGSSQAQVVTDFSGNYQFSVVPGGSWSLTAKGDPNFFTPPFQSCLVVTPSIVNLNKLTTSTVVNFVGSGNDPITNCAPAEIMGATTGSLTIKGVVTSGGLPVPGALVSLNGSAQGSRVTDETGAYSFSVKVGSYQVQASGATCASYTPGVVNLNNVKTSQTQNFQATGCPPPPLALCPTFDALFGIAEPSTCATTSSVACAGDRFATWDGTIENDWFNINAADCRFGQWNVPPIVDMFMATGFFQQDLAFRLFMLQLFGCAEAGNLDGPLGFPLIPPDIAKLPFTTGDLAALQQELVAAISQALSDNGSPPLTAAQLTAINAQLSSATKRVTGVTSSSTLNFSTCGADGGAE